MAVFFVRNTTIPAEYVYTIISNSDNPKANVLIELYNCEGKTMFGQYEFSDLPKGNSIIQINFNIDANGILDVTAFEKLKHIKIAVTNKKSRLTKEDTKHMIEEGQQLNILRLEDKEKTAIILARDGLETYCFNIKSVLDDENIKSKISEQSRDAVLAKCNEIIEWLKENEWADKKEYENRQTDLEICYSSISDGFIQPIHSSLSNNRTHLGKDINVETTIEIFSNETKNKFEVKYIAFI